MFSQRKYTMRWLRSILTILIASLILCSLLCLYVLHLLERNVMETNASLSTYVQRSVDSRLEDVHRYTMTLEIGSANVQLKNQDALSLPIPAFVYRFSDALRDYAIANKIVDGIYIYYPKSNFVVGNMGCYDASSYYILQDIPKEGGYGQWISQLMEGPSFRFAMLHMPGGDRFCYVRQMSVGGEIRAVVVAEINQEELLRSFDRDGLPKDATTGILLNGRMIAFTGDSPLLPNIQALFARWSTKGQINIKIGDNFVFFNAANMPGLDYVNILSASDILRSVNVTLYICIAGIVCCFLIGIGGSVYISRKNAKPMERILNTLDIQQTQVEDDCSIVMDKIEAMMEEKYKNDQLVQENQVLLNKLFLDMVLRGDIHSENAIFLSARKYEVSFDRLNYQILVVEGGVGGLVPDQSQIKSIYHILEDHGVDGIASMYGGRLTILLNMEEPLPSQEITGLLESVMEAWHGGRPAYAAAGACHDNMVDIITSYHQALLALHSMAPSVDHPIRFYDSSLLMADYGDGSLMQAFVHRIYGKQYTKAQQMAKRLYTEYIYVGAPPDVEGLRQKAVNNLLADALCTTLPMEEIRREIRSLAMPGSFGEQKKLTDRILARLAKASMPRMDDEKEPIALRAKRLIDENFTDSMMGLYWISERLNVSNSYLSTAFKNEHGVSVIQYINRMRIQQAKALILNTDMKIKEVAEAVGFASDINFIRVFKKLENQTPSTLRRQV